MKAKYIGIANDYFGATVFVFDGWENIVVTYLRDSYIRNLVDLSVDTIHRFRMAMEHRVCIRSRNFVQYIRLCTCIWKEV